MLPVSKQVVESIEDSNVVILLFETGGQGFCVVLYHWDLDYMFGEGKDAFKKYHSQEEYHNMVLEVIRYKSM